MRGLTPHYVVQTCWVVPDLAAAMRSRIALGFAPFLTMEVDDPGAIHRGVPAPFRGRAAFAQAGPMQIELIEPIGDGPSAYRDVYAPGEGGVHHILKITRDYAADVAALERAGIVIAQRGTFRGVEYCHADTRAELGCMLELVPAAPEFRAFGEAMQKTIAGWDGIDPVLPLVG